jgi:CheY-like chemotaxis protein
LQIASATSGKEAISLIHESASSTSPIDLVLLDINMPLMDGFGVLGELAKCVDPPAPPVVMCSTSSYDQDKERARARAVTWKSRRNCAS